MEREGDVAGTADGGIGGQPEVAAERALAEATWRKGHVLELEDQLEVEGLRDEVGQQGAQLRVGGTAGAESVEGGGGQGAEDESRGGAREPDGDAERGGVAETGRCAAEAAVLVGGEGRPAVGDRLAAQSAAGGDEVGEQAGEGEGEGARRAVRGGEDRREAQRGEGRTRGVGEADEREELA